MSSGGVPSNNILTIFGTLASKNLAKSSLLNFFFWAEPRPLAGAGATFVLENTFFILFIVVLKTEGSNIVRGILTRPIDDGDADAASDACGGGADGNNDGAGAGDNSNNEGAGAGAGANDDGPPACLPLFLPKKLIYVILYVYIFRNNQTKPICCYSKIPNNSKYIHKI
jgi:hypothetical protein